MVMKNEMIFVVECASFHLNTSHAFGIKTTAAPLIRAVQLSTMETAVNTSVEGCVDTLEINTGGPCFLIMGTEIVRSAHQSSRTHRECGLRLSAPRQGQLRSDATPSSLLLR